MINRRKFLFGLGGAAVALPLLESVRFFGADGRARAGGAGTPVFTVFVRQGNGVQQAGNGEPERFWPAALGALTTTGLAVDNADRAISELADYADRMLLVRGTRFGFPGNGCGHTGGINQVLTAARVTGDGVDSLADGESVDWFMAKRLNAGGADPLTLMSGPQSAYIAHGLSYSGPQALRGAENNPFAVYQDIMGLGGASQEVLEAIAARRKSVNDLVREEMTDLLSKSYLASADKQRLQTHFDAIRDLEITMACELAGDEVSAMEAIAGAAANNDNRLTVAKMMMDLVALAFACDVNRVSTLQIGTGNDGTRYYVDGVLQNTFHRISHRIDGDGSEGDPIPNADMLHHKIDRIFAQTFKHLLDRLDSYAGYSGGTLLDDTVAVWTNDLSNGPPHSYNNIPQVIVGRGGGFLQTGQYIDAGNVTHNRFLNTIISASGLTNGSGGYYDSFGDSSLTGGVIPAMIA
jgi:hypothetical protein